MSPVQLQQSGTLGDVKTQILQIMPAIPSPK